INLHNGYRILNTLSSFIKVHKDKLNKFQSQNVVYQINCQDCNASYVEQTKRQLKTHINEHRNNIWEAALILDVEKNYCKRIISEMLKNKTKALTLKKIRIV
ncbi:hypothetical protein ALC62_11175, partial [Cyphomyrmex costatus]